MVAHLRSLGWNVSDQYSHEDLTVDRMFTTTSAIVDKKRSRSLRIDAMCDRKGSRVAFEYNGPYHYYCKKIKRKPTIASLNNDWCKRLWCRSNGVRVICVSPAAPTGRDYLDFRYKVSSLATCLPLKGKMKYTTDSVRFLNAIGDVPKYLMHLGMWTVYVIRDDDACTTCLVVYLIDPGYECYCEGAGFCVVRQREPSLCAFAVTSWWREKQLEKDVVAYSKARDRGGDRVVSMDDYSWKGGRCICSRFTYTFRDTVPQTADTWRVGSSTKLTTWPFFSYQTKISYSEQKQSRNAWPTSFLRRNNVAVHLEYNKDKFTHDD